jgi:hypothetical protein
MVLLMTDRLPRGGSAAARGAEGLSRQPGARPGSQRRRGEWGRGVPALLLLLRHIASRPRRARSSCT